MLWLKVYETLPRHDKVVALEELLGVSTATVIGHLVSLWLWGVHNTKEGRLSTNPRTIARAAGWPGDAEVFVLALLEAGFVDEGPDGWLLHEWDEYGGAVYRVRESGRERKALQRRREKQDDHFGNGQTVSHGRHVIREVKKREENILFPPPAREEIKIPGEPGQELWAAFATAAGLTPGSRDYQVRLESGLPLLTAVPPPAIDPEQLGDMTRYLIADRSTAGILAIPTVAQVLERETEYRRWRQLWEDHERPLDQQNQPRYLLARELARSQPRNRSLAAPVQATRNSDSPHSKELIQTRPDEEVSNDGTFTIRSWSR